MALNCLEMLLNALGSEGVFLRASYRLQRACKYSYRGLQGMDCEGCQSFSAFGEGASKLLSTFLVGFLSPNDMDL